MPVPAPTRAAARHLLVAALAAATAACAASEAATVAPAARSAGDLSGTAAPDRSDAAIAQLRAAAGRDRGVLDRLLADHAAMVPGTARDALAATIDRVAGQRHATVSRLYWYTDLAAAQAAARRRGLPILSLRMLGRLDEDLSCANSRFFRTLLYANRALAAYLDHGFVLHWSSERPVPRVTIDFGDGRRLERTVTGNSAHYVLDADGRPVDVLPGLYAPAVFRAELERAAAVVTALTGKREDQRTALLRAHHEQRLAARAAELAAAGPVPVLAGARRLLDPSTVDAALAAAQRATMMKARIEIPDLQIIDVGADPGSAELGVPHWASIGQRVFGLGDLPRPGAAPRRSAPILDEQSRALVTALLAAPAGAPAADPAAVLAAVEQTLVADTALNELRLRAAIRAHLAGNPAVTFDALNAWVYREVFHTPADDAWLGLLPRTAYTGLAGDGLAVR
jgi:hypothetical protein